MEQAMVKEYGDKYVNLREYLSTKGLSDAGIKPTSEDTKAMSSGSVPPSLLSGKVNLNAKGYKLVGNLVYKRLVDLGYFKVSGL
ncbi:MAG: hypothetical protein Q8858_17510 [Bacteroidota bacterium]|nr:hypothetical protein [Bacteroidota bacterium]